MIFILPKDKSFHSGLIFVKLMCDVNRVLQIDHERGLRALRLLDVTGKDRFDTSNELKRK